MSQKHASIVGAGPGIGLGAARAFGHEGFAVGSLLFTGDGEAIYPDRRPANEFPLEVQYRGTP